MNHNEQLLSAVDRHKLSESKNPVVMGDFTISIENHPEKNQYWMILKIASETWTIYLDKKDHYKYIKIQDICKKFFENLLK